MEPALVGLAEDGGKMKEPPPIPAFCRKAPCPVTLTPLLVKMTVNRPVLVLMEPDV